ncbi:F-box protein CPR1-like [Rosa rugosa]|uniref:F-box protein CPR1-like n=1 Tax=Rosa rugosa TaxID=74645 RepID=UPI002B412D28|nr:F-box protein CPR1-like [Rosa rugosa]
MAESDLPEDVIVNILSWLPVKSLIRFTSVSKRFRSIILFDPKFARSQFKAACQLKTLGRRLLFSTDTPQLESLDLDAPWFGDISSVRKLSFPLKEPAFDVRLLGSCNGLVFVAVVVCDDFKLYIWNPLMGFFKELPQPGLSTLPVYYGVGYLSATDDYKLFAGSYGKEIEMFSLRAHVWKTIQNPGYNRGNMLA